MLTKNPFEGKKDINIVFLGGSITEGHAASKPENSYVGRCSKWLKEKFNTQNVNIFNAGIGGTGSDFGEIRMARDVLSKSVDMLFVEFAVNDGNNDSRDTMESIVRSAMSAPEMPYMVFLYTSRSDYTVDISYHEELAKYYGIPSINLQEALKEKINGKNPVELGLFLDGVHPLDGGFEIYADTITACLENDEMYKLPLAKPKMMDTTVIFNAKFVPSPEYNYSKGWTETTGHRGYKALYADTEGEFVELEFDGNYLGVEAGLHRETGLLDVFVDGELVKTVGYYYDMESYQTNYKEISHTLPMGHHNVKIVLKKETNEAHPGCKMKIYHIITGTAE